MTFQVHEIDSAKVGFDAHETGVVIMEAKLKRQRLIGMLMAELWKTHKSLGEPSYQIGRADRFPHHGLKQLNKAWDDGPLGPTFLK